MDKLINITLGLIVILVIAVSINNLPKHSNTVEVAKVLTTTGIY